MTEETVFNVVVSAHIRVVPSRELKRGDRFLWAAMALTVVDVNHFNRWPKERDEQGREKNFVQALDPMGHTTWYSRYSQYYVIESAVEKEWDGT